MNATNQFPRVFQTRAVELKAIELGIHTQGVVRDENEEESYFQNFELEVIEGTFSGISAKLEIAKHNGNVIAGWAFLGNGNDMQIEANQVSQVAAQIVK